MFVVETVDDLWNHIAYVISYAPNRFPYRDYLGPDGQMDLDKAFGQLRAGVTIAYPEDEYSSKREDLEAILRRSHEAYQSGDDIRGIRLLQEFEDGIFKSD